MVLLTYVDVDKIHPHPDNPRKNIGDITELADSIRENGVLQNLTLVPYFDPKTKEPSTDSTMSDHYMAIIGHRRLAAAKKAGIHQVPCVIKEMDYAAQVQTMLLENMQRSDLTPFEQAEGFQMMMDLGSSVADIVKNTGFSESTVRHRLKLMELDQKLLREKTENKEINISMFDLIKLEQITDPDVKNKALGKIGTKDFDWFYESEIKKQQREEKIKIFRELFEPYVDIKEVFLGGWTKIKGWDLGQIKLEDLKALDAEAICAKIKTEGYLYISTYGVVSLFAKPEMTATAPTEEELEQQKAYERQEARRGNLRDVGNRMLESRMRFVKHLPIKAAKENIKLALRKAAFVIGTESGGYWDMDERVWEIIGFDPDKAGDDQDTDDVFEKALQDYVKKYPELSLFQMIYCALEREDNPWNYYCKYEKGYKYKELMDLYSFLEGYGYEMSTEELQIMNGTHEFYREEE